jgi:hypothetical protein
MLRALPAAIVEPNGLDIRELEGGLLADEFSFIPGCNTRARSIDFHDELHKHKGSSTLALQLRKSMTGV